MINTLQNEKALYSLIKCLYEHNACLFSYLESNQTHRFKRAGQYILFAIGEYLCARWGSNPRLTD